MEPTLKAFGVSGMCPTPISTIWKKRGTDTQLSLSFSRPLQLTTSRKYVCKISVTNIIRNELGLHILPDKIMEREKSWWRNWGMKQNKNRNGRCMWNVSRGVSGKFNINRVTTKFPRQNSRIIQGYFRDFQGCQCSTETPWFNGQVLQCAPQKENHKRM